MNKNDIKIYDWNLEIFFSWTYLVYNNKLILKNIDWFNIILIFEKDNEDLKVRYDIIPEWKDMTYIFYNFDKKSLWTWFIKKKLILQRDYDNDFYNNLYMSIFCFPQWEGPAFFKTTITIYMEKNEW